jgi:hypothetical protein
LSSMVLSRENQKCVHRDKYIQTHMAYMNTNSCAHRDAYTFANRWR